MDVRVFVGRVAELHQLNANLRAARAGEFRVVLVAGEAGIGKSRLVAEFLDRSTDIQVMVGACLPLEYASLPYAPIIDALHGLVHAVPAPQLDELMGPARDAVGLLLPELEQDQPQSATGIEPAARLRFFDLILGVVERAATGTAVVLVIEDVQWADAATRDLLRFLVRGLRRAPVLMLLTLRTDELHQGDDVGPFVGELARLGSAARIDLPRFDPREVRALTADITGEPPSAAVVDRLHSRSDGIPFIIEQLILTEDQVGDLPPNLAETVLARLRNLSPEGRLVIGVAGACGRRIDQALIAAASGLEPSAVEAGIREAVANGILVPVAEGGDVRYEFRHSLFREAVDVGLLLSDRQRVHRAAAEALALQATEPGAILSGLPAELAYHWEAAGEWDRAFAAHVDAGAAAEHVYAWGSAVHHYDRAMAILERSAGIAEAAIDRGEILHRAADAAYLAGDYEQAIAWGREAISSVEGLDDARAGAYHERLRWYLWDSGDRRAAMVSVEEALRLIPSDPPSRARASALSQTAGVMMLTGRPDEAMAAAQEGLAVARATGAMSDVGQSLAIVGWIQVVRGDVELGLATLREAVSVAEAARDFSGIALGHALIANMLAWVGRPSEARDAALAGHERIVELGLQRTYGGAILGYAVAGLIAVGDWDEADRWIAESLEPERTGRPAQPRGGRRGSSPARARPAGGARGWTWLRINRARLLGMRGALADAVEELQSARALELASGGTEHADQLLAAEAELAAWRGELEATRAATAALAQRPPTAPFGPALTWVVAFGLMAEADEAERARTSGDTVGEGEAQRRARELAEIVRREVGGQAHLLASASWTALLGLVEAELARAEGNEDAGVWAEQVAAWTGAEDPFRTAYARYQLAAALITASGPTGESHEAIEQALATSQRLGAAILTERLGRLARPMRLVAPSEGVEIGEGTSRITVHALGRVRIERDGEPLRSLGGQKAGRRQAEALFAFLLDRGTKGVTKDEVIEMIWSEVDFDAADVAFHRTLGGLRRTLEPQLPSVAESAILFDHDRYRLDTRVIAWTDIGAFEGAVEEARSSPEPFKKASALEEARRLYRGDYFDDCAFFGDSAEVEPTRMRLRRWFIDVLVMLGELAEERGERGSAESYYHDALEVADGESPGAAEGLARVGALGRQLRVAEG